MPSVYQKGGNAVLRSVDLPLLSFLVFAPCCFQVHLGVAIILWRQFKYRTGTLQKHHFQHATFHKKMLRIFRFPKVVQYIISVFFLWTVASLNFDTFFNFILFKAGYLHTLLNASVTVVFQ